MPYIKSERKDEILTSHYVEYLDNGSFHEMYHIQFDKIESAGELQYAMAVMFRDYVERKGLNYQTLNDVMGAISGADKEFYRRVVVNYEQEKIGSNGDVY